MSDVVISVEDLSKQYRLGTVGTGTLRHDLNRLWHRVRGKEDPYLKIGQVNDRTKKADSEYVWALKDINFEVKQGEVLGIIGRNGAGKSTLLKILSKITAPTTGRVKVKGRIASLLEVGTGFHPELTGRENIFLNGAILGMRRKHIQEKIDQIIQFSGVERYIDTPVKRYSSGMQVRLAFAVAAHLESEVLIVDEVLAVGDAEFQKKCLGKMGEVSSGEGRTVLFVSHNISSLLNLCKVGILLNNGSIQQVDAMENCVRSYTQMVTSKLTYTNSTDSDADSPIITRAALITSERSLKVQAHFVSPYFLKEVIFGVVLYDFLRNPILGINNRFDKEGIQILNKNKGVITLEIDYIYLQSGYYTISLFLGDSRMDFFTAEDAFTFEATNPLVNTALVPSVQHIGAFFPGTRNWTFNEDL
jgi:lipopolysaccharide transport system ATP-binding protein